MAEIKKYLDTTALGTLVDQIKAEDAKVLAAAKKYTDDSGKLYEVAGAAATAEANAKAHTDALANGQVATNKADIAKLNGDANTEGSVAKAVADAKALVDADVDAVEAIANKNKEDIAAINHAETGILAQAKAEDAKIQGNIDALSETVEELDAYIGDIPTGYTETNIIAYINKKAEETLNAASGGSSESAASVLQALNTYKAENDPKVEANTTAAANAQAAADKAQGEVDALEQTHATDKAALEAEDARIVGLVEAEVERATGVENGLKGRIETMEAFWAAAQADGTDSNVIDTLKEIQEYITNDETGAANMLAAIEANEKAIEDMDAAYKAADVTLQNNIDLKADASVVEGINGRVEDLEEASATHATKDEVKAVSDDLAEYKNTHTGDYTNEQIDAAIKVNADAIANLDKTYATDAELSTAIENEVTRANAAYAAKSLEGTVDGLATTVAGKAAQADLDTVSGKVGTLETEMDAVEAKAAANETAIGTLNTAVAGKAAQTDLDNAVARIATNEGDISTLKTTVAAKAEQDDLDDAIERIEKNETDIAALTSSVNSFTAITSAEVEALFA